MNPNEILKRNFSPNNPPSPSSSEENGEDYHLLSHLNQHSNYYNENLGIHRKTSKFSINKERMRDGDINRSTSSTIPKLSPVKASFTSSKSHHLEYFCYDDMLNKRNPISPPINLVAISRNQSVSYAPRRNLNPILTPDERTSKPLQSVRFNVHIYWQNWPIKYQIELPRNVSFHRFKRVMSQMLCYELPNDLIVFYHTKRYTDDDMMMRSGSNEEINWLLLDYLCKSDKIRVVTHDEIWSIYLLMWNDDEVSVTLFSRSLVGN